MPQLIEARDRGATFFTTALLHRPFVETYRLHRADRRQEAVDLFATLLPYLAFKHQHLDVALHLIKRYAVERSVFTTNRVREPVLPFDGMHERHAAEVIAEVLEIEKSL